MSHSILDIFEAHEGVVSLVGAGGKKTTMFRLATAHNGRVGITSTVHTPPFRRRLNVQQVIVEPGRLFDEVRSIRRNHDRVAYAHMSTKPARLAGVSSDDISKIHEELGFDVTFVKADGARLRWLKAPDENEPLIPPVTSILIPVMSIRAIGMRLSDEVAHRAMEAARIMRIHVGDRITAPHLANLVTSLDGGLKNSGNATVIPVLNMAEGREGLRLGQLVAERTLELSDRIHRVVVASMVSENPIRRVIDR